MTKDIFIDINHQPVENHCLSFRGGAVVIGVENILPGISQILQRHLFVESGEGNIGLFGISTSISRSHEHTQILQKYLFGTGCVNIKSKCMYLYTTCFQHYQHQKSLFVIVAHLQGRI